LAGDVMVSSGVSFDSVVNSGEVFNHFVSTYAMTINTRLENHGTIRNHTSGNYFYLNLLGDLYDYGTIRNDSFRFLNTVQRVLWQDPSADPISSANVLSQATGNLQLTSNLRFSGSDINLNGNILIMYDGSNSYNLSHSGGKLRNGTLNTDGFSTLNLSDGVYIQSLNAEDIILQGFVLIAQNCSFDDVVNHGTIQNYYVSSYPLVINGNLINYDTIKNSPSGGYLYLNSRKDLNNYGTIQNNQVSIDGPIDQYVLNTGTINASIFQLASEIESAQWFYNGTLSAPGYTVNKNVDPNVQGVWQPRSTTTDGRYITIGNGATELLAPENLSVYFNLGKLKLRWDEVTDAIYYNVYMSATPDGSYALLDKVFSSNLGDGQVMMTLLGHQEYVDPPRFYKVTSGNYAKQNIYLRGGNPLFFCADHSNLSDYIWETFTANSELVQGPVSELSLKTYPVPFAGELNILAESKSTAPLA
jgi:hypothetical protein